MSAHGVHGRDLEVLVDKNLELGAVRLAHVRFVRRAVIDIGLGALDGAAADLRERRSGDLLRDVRAERLLLLAVGPDMTAMRTERGRPAAGRLGTRRLG